MAHKKEEQDFQAYLKLIEAGQPAEKILADIPEQAHHVRAELEAVEWLEHSRGLLEPRPGFVTASRKRLKTRLETPEGRQVGIWRSRWLVRYRSRSYGLAQSPVILAVLLVMLVGMIVQSGRVLAHSAPTWLPGDFLYPLKETGEHLSLLFSLSSEQRASRHIEFARQRLLEAQSLVFEGRYEEIAGAATDFSEHMDAALRTINQISRKDLVTARRLAGLLDVTLSQHNQLISTLVQACPDTARQDLQRVLAVSQNGLLEMKRIIDPGNSNASILTWELPLLAQKAAVLGD